MEIVAKFLGFVEAYAAATGLAESTISTRLFNDGKRIQSLRSGAGDIGVTKIELAIDWIAANWPEGARRPAGLRKTLEVTRSESAT